MVQEKDFSSSPSLPQASAKGGTMMPKEKAHAKATMEAILVGE